MIYTQLHYDQFYAAVQQRYLKYDSMLSSSSRIGWKSPRLSLPLYMNTMLDEFQNVQEELKHLTYMKFVPITFSN